jgi:hypothetical protein
MEEKEIRKVRALSVANLLKKRYVLFPFSGAWHDAFLQPETSGAWFIYGGSGNGKTSFTQQLVKYLSEDMGRRVAYLSLEELAGPTMQLSVIRSEWKGKGGRIKVLSEMYSPDEIDAWLGIHKSPDVVVIDSVQYWTRLFKFTFTRYQNLIEKHPRKLFVFISQVKNNEPVGAVAQQILSDAALKIFVQGYRAFSKGRYMGPVGYYPVWPEKEKEIWVK